MKSSGWGRLKLHVFIFLFQNFFATEKNITLFNWKFMLLLSQNGPSIKVVPVCSVREEEFILRSSCWGSGRHKFWNFLHETSLTCLLQSYQIEYISGCTTELRIWSQGFILVWSHDQYHIVMKNMNISVWFEAWTSQRFGNWINV